jgi:hypothetical protein
VSLNYLERETESGEAGGKDRISSAFLPLTGFGINSVETSGSSNGA